MKYKGIELEGLDKKLITVLVARPGQVARYYEPFGEDVPDWLMNRAYENTCVRHLNY